MVIYCLSSVISYMSSQNIFENQTIIEALSCGMEIALYTREVEYSVSIQLIGQTWGGVGEKDLVDFAPRRRHPDLSDYRDSCVSLHPYFEHLGSGEVSIAGFYPHFPWHGGIEE